MDQWTYHESRIYQMIAERQFHHEYQPIYRFHSWHKVGYEALLRSPMFQDAEEILHTAKVTQHLYEMDTLSMMYALSFYRSRMFSSHLLLFLNLFPSTITHPSFLSFLEQNLHSYHNIVLEINEWEIVPDYSQLENRIARLKEKGFSIAVDDFGKGETSVEATLAINPTFVKLDRSLTKGISVSQEKRERVRSLNDLFLDKGIRVILEGIEEPADLAMAKAIGIEMGQGFLLGVPESLK